jgi:GTP-binding protein HflX
VQVRDRDLLVLPVRVRRRSRAVVDRVDALLGELRDRRPRLLRGDLRHERAQALHERVREGGGSRGRVVEDVQLSGRDELAQPRFGLVTRASGCVAEVELHRGSGRNDVGGDAALDPHGAHDLAIDEPVALDVERFEPGQGREAVDKCVDRVPAGPRSCRVGTLSVELHTRLEIPETTRVEDRVRRLEDGRELDACERAARKDGWQRALLQRDLLPREEQVPSRNARPRELEHHGNATLHVAGAEAMDGTVLDPARNVVLRRHRVEVPGENDRRRGVPPHDRIAVVVERSARQESPDEVHRRTLGAARRRHVDELQRAGREVGSGHGRSHNDGRMAARQPDRSWAAEPERGLVLAVLAPGADGTDELAELEELARTAGVEPVDRVVQHRSRPDPRTYVGKGKLVELKQTYSDAGAEVLLIDDELSPAQQRELENTLQARVVDRTQLILDIFAQHAVSAEGKLQVELAQLEYNLPRMRGMWQHLERLGGGTGGLGAGVGTRGPGESQLETDRRLARRRITLLRERLRKLSRQRDVRRKERSRAETPTVALAGYTNTGKSTLLNGLTDAGVSVRDRLFETLDPTTRGFEHEGRRYLVTDTVGFVRRLPHQLVEGFAATLEETLVADLVLHVVDGSAPEQQLVEQIAAVDTVLREIGADKLPVELVLNKTDVVDTLGRRRLANRYPEALQISALTGEGLEELRARVAERFGERFERVRLLLPYEEGRRLNELYALGAPIEEREDTPDGVLVVARLPRRELRRFARYLLAEAAPKRRRTAK